ncbi:EKC/KEOPS complex subunit LAGE3 isoform X2 [Rhinatrema bivittatum]|uniref:EKC/KEOPS complex subunit LAGE3 isoform X2 n=1 Tax=Rhinatrema bivittatum TaxID=194408 RepID=UPI0011261C8F|nr:EKC/KEOPS complex subunit LAGE3 isoform X2 [Rhinatrema bivittatum]
MAGAARLLSFTLTVPFPSCLEAKIAHDTLAPDAEPRRGGITKQLSVNGNILHVQWQAEEARILRVSVSSFLDLLSLTLQTMDRKGDANKIDSGIHKSIG